MMFYIFPSGRGKNNLELLWDMAINLKVETQWGIYVLLNSLEQ